MDTKEQKIVDKAIKELLKQLGIEATFTVEAQDDVLAVFLETQDTGIVIGYHGEVLEALQLILSLIVSKKLGRFLRVMLEVGDYRKNRTGWLENVALSAKEKVLVEQQEVILPDLKAWERRIVHLLFQDDKDVMSESVGEGRERTLVIKPRG